MKKKLLALLSLLSAATMVAFGAIGCGETDKPDNSQDSSSNLSTDTNSGDSSGSSSDSSDEKNPTLAISQETLALEVYESATLTATLTNSEETLVWSSSDESVVKVVDGVVTAYKAGTATVSVTAGELSASCEVTVAEGTETPVFTDLEDSYEIMKGTSEELDLSLSYKGAAFEGATISVTTESEILSIEENVVTASAYGEATVTVTATFGDTVIASKTIAITVYELVTFETGLAENKLQLWLGQEGFAISNIVVEVNGEEVENPEFTVTSDNEEVVKYEDGKLTAVTAGETTVKVCYTTEVGTYDTVLTVVVAKEKTVKSVNFLAQGDQDKTVADTGNAVIDLTEAGIDLSQVSKVLCEDEEVTFAVDGTNLTLTNAPGGYRLYTLVTPTVDYVIDGCVYGYSVSTAEELLEWRKKASSWLAYTVLENDIDLQGVVLEEGIFQLLGGFDGRGYTISNFTFSETSGFFYYIHAGAEMRNVQFVNVVQDCAGQAEGVHVKMGLFGDNLMGTLENIVVKMTIKNMLEGTDHYGLLAWYFSGTAVAKNVVVYAEASGCTPHYLYACAAGGEDGSVIDNIHLVSSIGGAVAGKPSTNSGVYTTTEAMLGEAKVETWGGLWQVTESGVPCMSDYLDDELNAYITATGEATLGGTITFASWSFAPLTYALAEETTGISVVNNQVFISEEAVIDAEFTVNVTCATLPDFSQQFTFKVLKEAVEIEGIQMAQGNGTSANATGVATITLDSVNFSNVNSITFDGEVSDFVVASGNTITFTNAPGGDHMLIIETDTATYTLKVCVYTHAISTAEEFLEWRGDTSGTPTGYYVLTQNIDMQGVTLSEGAKIGNHARSTLDGRGYSISNFTYTRGIVRGVNNGCIKNIAFLDVTQDCTGLTNGYGFFGNYVYACTIENVYLDITTINLTGEHYGVLFVNAQNANAVVRNIVLELDNKDNKFSYAYGSGSVEGSTIEAIVGAQCKYENGTPNYNIGCNASEGDGKYAPWAQAGGFQEKLDWMIANEKDDEILLFTSPYWAIDTVARTIELKPW